MLTVYYYKMFTMHLAIQVGIIIKILLIIFTNKDKVTGFELF
jgi:uncharacterized integral membrane protein